MNPLAKKNEKIPVALALGGNLGDVEDAFRKALELLAAGGVTGLVTAPVFVTAPVGCLPGTPDFRNSAATGFWSGTPEALLDLTQSIEVALGRPAGHGFHTSRTLDLDIILFGDRCIRTARLTVPHPEAARREFVLEPLAEIAPELRFPDSGLTVREALRKLKTGK